MSKVFLRYFFLRIFNDQYKNNKNATLPALQAEYSTSLPAVPSTFETHAYTIRAAPIITKNGTNLTKTYKTEIVNCISWPESLTISAQLLNTEHFKM